MKIQYVIISALFFGIGFITNKFTTGKEELKQLPTEEKVLNIDLLAIAEWEAFNFLKSIDLKDTVQLHQISLTLNDASLSHKEKMEKTGMSSLTYQLFLYANNSAQQTMSVAATGEMAERNEAEQPEEFDQVPTTTATSTQNVNLCRGLTCETIIELDEDCGNGNCLRRMNLIADFIFGEEPLPLPTILNTMNYEVITLTHPEIFNAKQTISHINVRSAQQ